MMCRPLAADDSTTKKVEFIGFDITGGDIEYDILASQGPNTTLRKVCTPCVLIECLVSEKCNGLWSKVRGGMSSLLACKVGLTCTRRTFYLQIWDLIDDAFCADL